MKLRLPFTIVLLVLASVAAHAAKPEFRALWVHNWLPGMLSPAQVDDTVKWAKCCNMNALVVQVRRLGDAYYDSAYEPRACNIQGGPSYDPLAYITRQAKANGMEVHAWFNVFKVCTKAGAPTDYRHVANRHPEWLSKDVNGVSASQDGAFLDPGVPEVREYLKKVVADLVTKYNVNGLMLDYIRYPGKNWGYNDKAVAAFNRAYARTGKPSPDDPDWCSWRRDQVTATVRAIYHEVQSIRPGTKVSAATIAWGSCPSTFEQTSAYKAVFQDWRSWMRDGIIDANMPMNYKNPSDTRQSRWFDDWVRGFRKWSYGRHVYCGLMVYSVAGAAEQVQCARSEGVDGIVGLAFSQTKVKTALASELKSTVFSEPTHVPSMPWKKTMAKLPKRSKTQRRASGAHAPARRAGISAPTVSLLPDGTDSESALIGAGK